MYKLDCYRCADELFSFYKTFSKFNQVSHDDTDNDAIGDDDDSAQAVDQADVHEGAANADKGMTGTLAAQTEDEQHRRMRPPSFIDALAIHVTQSTSW